MNTVRTILYHKTADRVKAYIRTRKVTSGIVALVLFVGGYFGVSAMRGDSSETRYVLAVAARRAIISSVTGTGQVSASGQVALKTKAAGDVIYIGVANGQEVKTGTLILQLDTRDAKKAVRDAEANLASAKLSHQKLVKPADTLSLIQAKNALSQAQSSLAKAYDDGFNSVSNAFLNLPALMAGLYDITAGTKTGRSGEDNLSAYAALIDTFDAHALALRDTARAAYDRARDAYERTFLGYRAASRLSEKALVETLVNDTYDTTKTIAEAVKATNDFLGVVNDRLTEHHRSFPATLAPHLSSLATYIGQTNTHLLALLGIKDALTTAKYAIAERTESLAKLQAGAEALDVSASELAIRQRENALQDAREKLADYFVRAPFDGAVAAVSVKRTDSVGSGASVGTFITKQKVAEISLNEVDISTVSVGQEAALSFDAIDRLVLRGKVIEIETVGAISQGVVTYSVKIGFDSPDTRVKPGMSVTAVIETGRKEDALSVPQGAVKSQGRSQYVEVADEDAPVSESGSRVPQGILLSAPPERRAIEVGVSNDAFAEIVSGLREGEQVVTRTIAANANGAAPQPQAPTIFGASGGGRGGAVRFQR